MNLLRDPVLPFVNFDRVTTEDEYSVRLIGCKLLFFFPAQPCLLNSRPSLLTITHVRPECFSMAFKRSKKSVLLLSLLGFSLIKPVSA